MSLNINSDISSMFTLGSMRKTQQAQASALAKIASGKRINQAADDAAGMQIANLLSSQARGFAQEIRNTADSIAGVQIADSSLGQGTEILQTIREKAIQAAGPGQSAESRQALQAEIDSLTRAYNTVVDNTTYGGQRLLGDELRIGSGTGQTGQDGTTGTETEPPGGLAAGIDVTTTEGAQAAIEAIDRGLSDIAARRSDLGSRQNQLVSEMSTLATAALNTTAAQSRVEDADLAEEVMILNQMNVLRQTGIFALTQGMNLNKTGIMDLLQGSR